MGETVEAAGAVSFEAASGAGAGVDAGVVGLVCCGDGVLSASLWYDTLKDLHWHRRQALAVVLALIVARLSMMCSGNGSIRDVSGSQGSPGSSCHGPSDVRSVCPARRP